MLFYRRFAGVFCLTLGFFLSGILPISHASPVWFSPPATTETILLADDFSSASVDGAKWAANNLFSGYTDASLTLSQGGAQLQVGPLYANASGSHYNGLRSAATYDFSNAYAYVELLQPPNSTTAADAMFTIGSDADNYYRIYYETGALKFQKRIAGTKTSFLSLPYDSLNHKFLRIRHDSTTGNVIFETAPDSGGGIPGGWVNRYSESWDTGHVILSAILFEVKAGTWQAEPSAPGTVTFDNFKAAKTSSGGPSPLPQFGHVFVVLEENHSYSQTIGGAAMPYLNTLAGRYGLATSYYANTHPSIGNYFMLTTGQIITNDDGFSGTVSSDNLARQLINAGKTWKAYAESLPSTGYTGGDQYPYIKHHNPFAYFSDVVNNPVQANNLVPFSQFQSDLSNNRLPNYSFIVPNRLDDAHDCPNGGSSCTDADKLAAADSWLKSNIDSLIASPVFQQDGLLLIVFDESVDTDTAFGGGQVAMLVISAKTKQAYQSSTFYQHQSALRLTAEALGLSNTLGAAASAPDMDEFFSTTPNTAPLINGVTPNTGSTAGGAVITITGTGFASGAGVNIGGTPAANVSVTGSTSITATTPPHSAGTVNITVTNPNGQSGSLTSGFTYTSSQTETVLLADDFSSASVDSAKWAANNLFSGYTDASLTLSQGGAQLQVGPLYANASGSHYNGLRSAATYDFSNAYAYVKLAQAPAASTAADAMLTIGIDADNYYRIYVEAGALKCQKKTGGTKVTPFSTAYNAVNHKFLRIRHDSATGRVVFEAAPDNGGVPGTWAQLYSEAWDTSNVPLARILFEVKAGTWQAESSAPGAVIFDTFKAAKP